MGRFGGKKKTYLRPKLNSWSLFETEAKVAVSKLAKMGPSL